MQVDLRPLKEIASPFYEAAKDVSPEFSSELRELAGYVEELPEFMDPQEDLPHEQMKLHWQILRRGYELTRDAQIPDRIPINDGEDGYIDCMDMGPLSPKDSESNGLRTYVRRHGIQDDYSEMCTKFWNTMAHFKDWMYAD